MSNLVSAAGSDNSMPIDMKSIPDVFAFEEIIELNVDSVVAYLTSEYNPSRTNVGGT